MSEKAGKKARRPRRVRFEIIPIIKEMGAETPRCVVLRGRVVTLLNLPLGQKKKKKKKKNSWFADGDDDRWRCPKPASQPAPQKTPFPSDRVKR